MGRPAAKANKVKPACANQVRVFAGAAGGGFTVYRKGRGTPKRAGCKAPAKPSPRKWGNLAVFMDVSKRSYHVGWNRERFAAGAQLERIEREAPELLDKLQGRLTKYRRRLIRAE